MVWKRKRHRLYKVSLNPDVKPVVSKPLPPNIIPKQFYEDYVKPKEPVKEPNIPRPVIKDNKSNVFLSFQ